MKVLIVDDERKSRELLQAMLTSFCKEISQIYLAPDTQVAREILEKESIDLVFLDIEMPKQNGIEFLATFDIISFEVIITTAYEKYAIDAFHQGAGDYLLKPYNPERLVLAVDRVVKNIQSRTKQVNFVDKISIPTMHGFSIVKTDQIEYLKAEGNYTKLYLKDGTSLLVSKILKRFEDQLLHNHFIRIHRSSIVNIDSITGYLKGKTAQIILTSGAHLEVSNSKREKVIEILNII